MYEVKEVAGFVEPIRRQQSKYARIADGKVYELNVKNWGVQSTRNLAMNIRSYARSKSMKEVHVRQVPGHPGVVRVQMVPEQPGA